MLGGLVVSGSGVVVCGNVVVGGDVVGQSRTVHPSVSTGNPTQYTLPSGGGGGLLHRRARVLKPLPQVALQVVQLPQFDQFGGQFLLLQN